MILIVKDNRGVSLLELLVVVGLFSVAVVLATSIFQAVTNGQRNAIAAQNVQEDIRFAFETIGREVRMAQISNNECKDAFNLSLTTDNKIYNTTDSGAVLYFKNYKGICVKYFLDNGCLKITRGDRYSADYCLTSSKLNINSLNFQVVDNVTDGGSTVQPEVTVVVDVEYAGQDIHKQQMRIQTSISSRTYE